MITSNIQERIKDNSADLKVELSFTPFMPSDNFKQAAVNVSKSLSDHVFLAFSGGVDSEFVFKLFCEQNVNFTPIIVIAGDSLETQRAISLCQKHDKTPVILRLTEKEYLDVFIEKIYKRYNGIGLYAVPQIIASEYANGNVVFAEHCIGDDGTVEFAEWDFYAKGIPFFLYNMDILYHVMKGYVKYDDSYKFKCTLFDIQHRHKQRLNLSRNALMLYHKLLDKRIYTPSYSINLNKPSFLEQIEKYVT